jgi:hypothetical protein
VRTSSVLKHTYDIIDFFCRLIIYFI